VYFVAENLWGKEEKKMEILNLGFENVRELTKIEDTRSFAIIGLFDFGSVSFSFFWRNYKNREEEFFYSMFSFCFSHFTGIQTENQSLLLPLLHGSNSQFMIDF
jgi:hypothetical protein